MISTATRVRPKITVCRPARRNGSAHRWASVRAEPRRAGGRIQDRRVHEQEMPLPDGAPFRSMSRPAVR